MTQPDPIRHGKPLVDHERIVRAIAVLQADTSNGGAIARHGDRMAALYAARLKDTGAGLGEPQA
jgi:hypothetical protein